MLNGTSAEATVFMSNKLVILKHLDRVRKSHNWILISIQRLPRNLPFTCSLGVLVTASENNEFGLHWRATTEVYIKEKVKVKAIWRMFPQAPLLSTSSWRTISQSYDLHGVFSNLLNLMPTFLTKKGAPFWFPRKEFIFLGQLGWKKQFANKHAAYSLWLSLKGIWKHISAATDLP